MKPTLLILLLLSITTICIAQNGGTISSVEKKQLETKFKALSNFYIDDTGLVVYRDQSSSQPIQANQPSRQSISIQNDDARVVSVRTESLPVVRKEPITTNSSTPAVVNATNIKPPIKKYEGSVSSSNAPVNISKQPISTSSQKVMVVEQKSNSDQNFSPNVDNENKSIANKTKSTQVGTQSTKVKSQGSIFDRRRKSEYKNMEEAALAVEALLDDLKKEQVTLKGSGSMSSRLAKGVTKDLRRKESIVSNPYQSVTKHETLGNTFDDDESIVGEYGNEPSYFINGVQVEKIQINRLTKDDIINREIRVKNTVTNNPNGEIWYTVREKAVY